MLKTKAHVESEAARAETEAMREALRVELAKLAAMIEESERPNATD